MPVRPLLVLSALAALAFDSAAQGAQAFVPSPRQAFEGFVAINAPRPDVPVGALWVDGFGPVGEAASADNVETVRSLNGLTIDKGLQLSLSVGLLQLLGIDPRYRDRLTARFADLAIVRVKDVSKLSGPKGEPRILEAIKAASVTVSSDGEFGINGRSIGWSVRDVDGQGTTGRTRAFSIEGRDMFIAMRVATAELTAGAEEEVELRSAAGRDLTARFRHYEIRIAGGSCDAQGQNACPQPAFALVKLSSHPAEASGPPVTAGDDGSARVALPVPVADGDGGLFDSLRLRWLPPCSARRTEGCRRRPRLFAQFLGTRLADMTRPQAKGWL